MAYLLEANERATHERRAHLTMVAAILTAAALPPTPAHSTRINKTPKLMLSQEIFQMFLFLLLHTPDPGSTSNPMLLLLLQHQSKT